MYIEKKDCLKRIKDMFPENNNISDEYIQLICDYINCLYKAKNKIDADIDELLNRLPKVVNSVVVEKFTGYDDRDKPSKYENGTIHINYLLHDKMKKISFFRELTTALQTRLNNECGLYDGKTGMMFKEAEIQYIAETLYAISNKEELKYENNYDEVIGLKDHVVYSSLSNYKLSEDLFLLFISVLGIKKNQAMGIGFNPACHDVLKSYCDNIEGIISFDELMLRFDKIYYIDQALREGYTDDLSSKYKTIPITMDNGDQIEANLNVYNELIIDVQLEMMDAYFINKSMSDIKEEYSEIVNYFTTEELKKRFIGLAGLSIEETLEEKKYIKK